MTQKSLLILGGASDIGLATAHEFASDGYDLILAARNIIDLERQKLDFQTRYNIDVTLVQFDALDTDSHENFLQELPSMPDVCLCAVGFLADQGLLQSDQSLRKKVLRSNFEGLVSILELIAHEFEVRKYGAIIGISSVAGLRGRASNYIYGSAKAGFIAYLSGLRNRLASKNIQVLTVLPGFVATKMTEDVDMPQKLVVEPKIVGRAIFDGFKKNRNVIYVPFIWRIIMLIITNIPEFIFKKMKI